jgi:hypothetical protein
VHIYWALHSVITFKAVTELKPLLNKTLDDDSRRLVIQSNSLIKLEMILGVPQKHTLLSPNVHSTLLQPWCIVTYNEYLRNADPSIDSFDFYLVNLSNILSLLMMKLGRVHHSSY